MAEDPYVYPGTRVLRNRFGVRDASELARREADATLLRIAQLRERPLPGRYDLAHLQAFHRHIFGDVYPWAGELRTVAIAKTDLFALPQHVEPYLTDVLAGLRRENYLRGQGREQAVDRLAHYLAEINAAHPFREGNGRTQRAFIGQLAQDAGYTITWERVDPQRNVDASIAAMRGDNTRLRALLADALDQAPGRAAPLRATTAHSRPVELARPPARLTSGPRALLGDTRARELEQRADELAEHATHRSEQDLRADRDAALAAFAELDAAAAAHAGRLEATAAAAAQRAMNARALEQNAETRAVRERGRHARDLRELVAAARRTVERAEHDRRTAENELEQLAEQGRHPDRWLARHDETAARGVAADHELATRQPEAPANREPDPDRSRDALAAPAPDRARERPTRTPGPQQGSEQPIDVDVGYDV